METTGERIKRIREGVPLSQKRLGEEAKVEQGYISRWEANKLWPSPESLKRVAEVLSVNHIYLQHCGSAWKRDPVSGVIGVE